MAPSFVAPVYTFKPREVVAVEHPMVIKNIDNGLKTFGRTPALREIIDTEDFEGCIPLYLRYNDPMCAPVLSHNAPTSNLLLKITVPKRTGRKRKRGTQDPFDIHSGNATAISASDSMSEETSRLRTHSRLDQPAKILRSLKDNVGRYKIEPVAEIERTHRFRALADFTQSAAHGPFMGNFRETVLTGKSMRMIVPFYKVYTCLYSAVEKMREFKFDPSRGPKPNDEIIPPPSLTDHPLPQNWGYHQNPNIRLEVNSTTGENVLINQSRPSKVDMAYLAPDVEKIPDGPLFPVPHDPMLQSLVSELKKVLEERPIWTRRALANRVGDVPGIYLFKIALQYIGYQFRAGPFRDAVIKFGVDPRTDPKYRIYQTLFFKVYDDEERAPGTPWQDIRSEYKRRAFQGLDNTTNHIFDGKSFTLDGKVWQACDITDPLLFNLIATAPLRDKCENKTTDGWFCNGRWAKVKAIMRTKLMAIRVQKTLSDEDFAAALKIPDQVDKRVIHVPVPDVRLTEEEVEKLKGLGIPELVPSGTIRKKSKKEKRRDRFRRSKNATKSSPVKTGRGGAGGIRNSDKLPASEDFQDELAQKAEGHGKETSLKESSASTQRVVQVDDQVGDVDEVSSDGDHNIEGDTEDESIDDESEVEEDDDEGEDDVKQYLTNGNPGLGGVTRAAEASYYPKTFWPRSYNLLATFPRLRQGHWKFNIQTTIRPEEKSKPALMCLLLKCDRNQPCGQCMRRDKASSCYFPPPAPRKKPPMSMQKRLVHLESLVKNVMTGHAPVESLSAETNQSTASRSPDPPSPPSIEDTVKNNAHQDQHLATPESVQSEPPKLTSGQVLLGTKETTYVGATHWAAILEDIEEMKSYCNAEEFESSESPESLGDLSGSSLLFNAGIPSTREEILAFLPPRHVVDRYVSRYFNSSSPALHITHRPAFQREYKKFWADPGSTPIVWVGILYGMMCLSAHGSRTAGQEPIDTRELPEEVIRSYRACCAQCLVLSEYTKPGAHTLEAFILYSEVEFIVSRHDQVSCYLFIGSAVRLALRMGLHRDPTKVGGDMSPFQGEMRRRMWQVITQIDLLSSFHIGLPSMIHAIETDTLYPRNLLDTDFDEDSTELPPSRPEDERTPLSYTLAKGRVAVVFGQIAAQANLLSLPNYQEVIMLDGLLNEAYAQVPPFLRIRTLDQSVIDPPDLIIQRYSISLLYNKSRCVLHRRYLLIDKENPNYKFSRDVCLESSFRLLSYQSDMHEAVQGSGILSRHSWFNSTISTHDFLLAAMILYLNIVQMKEKYSHTESIENSEKVRFNEMVRALERSHYIWKETQSQSGESRKSYDVLGGMMKKIHHNSQKFSSSGVTSAAYNITPQTTNNGGNVFISTLSLSEPSAAVPQLEQTGFNKMWTPHTSPDSNTSSSGPSMQYESGDIAGAAWGPPEPLGSILDAPNDFDWQIFDDQMRLQPSSTASYPYQPADVVGPEDYYNIADPNALQ
ncbi:hypothetical protein B7463_g1097, partial [Scytalidium lignicola]